MSEKPILFSAPMVRALLDGSKTQTRRVVKPQPTEHHWRHIDGYELSCKVVHGLETFVRFRHHLPNQKHLMEEIETVKCPYGKPGDKLWVRETFRPWGDDGIEKLALATSTCTGPEHIQFRASADEASIASHRWRPAIFMPRWAARITLTVTDVRIQRIQDITLGDIVQEVGAKSIYDFKPAQDGFRVWQELWDSLNGAGSWEANPWVYALTFTAEKQGDRTVGTHPILKDGAP